MIELETRGDSDNDKHNKHHKYTLEEALQAVLEFKEAHLGLLQHPRGSDL